MARGPRVEQPCSRTSENALFAKLNIVLFIICLHANEERLAVNKSDTLHATSVNF